jgi:hypothetical protein
MFKTFITFIIISCAVISYAGDNNIYLSLKSKKNFISVANCNTLISYLEFFTDNIIFSRNITIAPVHLKSYFVSNNTPYEFKFKNQFLDLVNFRYEFLEIKDNVVPFLNKLFLQKIIFLLSKIGFRPRITDAFRTPDNQLKYKRRRWSSVEISPHLLGLAVDMVDYSAPDREIIKKLSEKLGLKFLFHGGRGSRHIHLQDEKLWEKVKDLNISEISDSLNLILKTRLDFKDVEETDSLDTNSNTLFTYNYKSGIYDRLIFRIENLYGEKIAEINSGIYEPGDYKINIRFDFLKKGFYKINIYEGNRFTGQKYYIRY